MVGGSDSLSVVWSGVVLKLVISKFGDCMYYRIASTCEDDILGQIGARATIFVQYEHALKLITEVWEFVQKYSWRTYNRVDVVDFHPSITIFLINLYFHLSPHISVASHELLLRRSSYF